jgi:hypothetical protein
VEREPEPTPDLIPVPAPLPSTPPPIPAPLPAYPTSVEPERKLTTFSYTIERSANRTLKGARTHFQFSLNGEDLLHSKLKSDSPDMIFISKGSAMHFSDTQYEGVLLVSDDLTSYSVRRKNQYGDELAAVRFTSKPPVQKAKQPRNVKVTFFGQKPALPPTIGNRVPVRSLLGKWSLDFGNRPIVSSVKNTILVDGDDREICAVRKTAANTMALDAVEDMDPLIVFAIGITSFLCKLP